MTIAITITTITTAITVSSVLANAEMVRGGYVYLVCLPSTVLAGSASTQAPQQEFTMSLSIRMF
jgi:hypothetical protein